LRPSGYEPDELPGCSTPHQVVRWWFVPPSPRVVKWRCASCDIIRQGAPALQQIAPSIPWFTRPRFSSPGVQATCPSPMSPLTNPPWASHSSGAIGAATPGGGGSVSRAVGVDSGEGVLPPQAAAPRVAATAAAPDRASERT